MDQPPIPLGHDLSGKVAVITGSTAGLGYEIARYYMAAGANVVLNGRRQDVGKAAEARLTGEGHPGGAAFVAADVLDLDDCRRLFDEAETRFGGVDIFVHGAGVGISPRPFQQSEPEMFKPLVDGHLLTALQCCRLATPKIIARGGGSIITIASDAGKVATPGEAVIGALKAAVIMFSRGLALELSRHDIRVNCLTPSFVLDTPANQRLRASEFTRRLVEKADERARLGPARPGDIAALALFLASPMAERLTGQAISVNGGISAA